LCGCEIGSHGPEQRVSSLGVFSSWLTSPFGKRAAARLAQTIPLPKKLTAAAEGTAMAAVGTLMALLDKAQSLVAGLRATGTNDSGTPVTQIVEQQDVAELQASLASSSATFER
jgi:hypothetical protein